MKKLLAFLLSLILLLSVFSVMTFAAEENDISKFELPAPKAPNYFVYTDGDATEGHHDHLRMIMVADPEVALLAAEYDRDSDAFREKYGLWSFEICIQYDVSLDGEDNWQHNEEWDTNWYTDGIGNGYPYVSLRSELMESFEFFWLTYYEGEDGSVFEPYKPAITTYVYHHGDWDENIYSFDVENHSLYIRCRYYMEYYSNDEQIIRTGEWSDIAVIGKGSTQRVPAEPKSYAAPVISEMKVVPPEGTQTEAHVYFELDTPDSVWDAEIYYAMHDEWGLDELDAQINVNGGGWQDVYVGNAHWPLYEGDRVTSTTAAITEKSHVQLRVRYGGPLGYSDWSNVLSVNAPDFDASSWAQSELQQAEALGLIPEILDGADLTADITRAEFAAVSVKVYEALSGTPALPAVANPFTDTADPEILKAYNIGAVNGTSATTYSPNDLLNREQAAAMLTRVFKRVTLPGWTLATDANFKLDYTKPALFADDADISDWAKESVYFMAANNIINGVGNNKFAPKNITTEEQAQGYANATREQALIIAMRMVENLK